ncbi:proton-conducting transporter transmembrane domain-containing protein [Pyrococcus yayanosii]|uniref:Putative monovalent cation/H+ antiporter subunit D n=1 Tax=Pyrococcus yayanosii (strain CH1 / JCM 16557) TaxID=529709 RepID=F8AI88_PYRYC|nr:proton-conducting transporter membrane subunit [Pyrococcus yayanosii]AEH24320.1 putative monovalent cation/H+ antiporter subunit D [Pyrococcus yayanosii CH1]
MNPLLLPAFPLTSALLVYLFGTLKWEGSIRARFRFPLLLEIKFLFAIGSLTPLIILPFVNERVIVGNYPQPIGIEVGIWELNWPLLLAEVVVFGAAALYALRRVNDWKELSLFLIMHGGLLGAFISLDLFNFYIFMELASVASFALIALSPEKGARKAAFKYLMLSIVASYLFIFSLGVIYAETGYLNAELIREVAKPSKTLLAALSVALASLLLKAGIFPLHVWLPDTHSKAKTHVSAVLSGLAVKAPIYGMLLLQYSLGIPEALLLALRLIAIASMIFGVVMALFQTDVKRLLAYHTVSQMGYVLLGIALNLPGAVALYALAHAIFKGGLFLSLGALADARRSKELSRLGARGEPVLLTAVLLLSLAIAGFGPSIGGVVKGILAVGTLEKLAIYGVSVGTAASFTKVNYYLRSGYGHGPGPIDTVPGLVLALLALILGVLLGGNVSPTDALLVLGLIVFLALKLFGMPRREMVLDIDVGEGVALLSLLTTALIVLSAP